MAEALQIKAVEPNSNNINTGEFNLFTREDQLTPRSNAQNKLRPASEYF